MSAISVAGDTSGSITLQAPAVAGSTVLTLPTTSATLITDSSGILNIGSGQVYKDASGNMGIGTSGTSGRLTLASTSTDTTNYYNGTRLSLQNLSATNGNFTEMSFMSANGNDYAAIWGVCASHTSSATTGAIVFGTANAAAVASERMRIDSSGNVTLQKNISVGAASPTTSGTGITFPSTASPSTDAYTLDDYREGTYTPVVSSITGTITSYTSSASYIKIGRVVTIGYIITITNNGTGAGNVLMTLPFTIGSQYCSGVARENALTGNTVQVFGNPSGTQVLFNYLNTYPAVTGSSFIGSLTYICA